jgi:uncharacterized alpha-E superfamily protein
MLSRVACSLYWFGRYVERAENTARLVGVNANLLLDLPRRTEFGWAPLIAISGGEEVFRLWYDRPDETSVIRFLLTDANNPDSIASSLAQARENLRSTRDVFPREAWSEINDLFLFVQEQGQRAVQLRHRLAFLERVIRSAQQLSGLLDGTMSHDEAYRFLRLGYDLERADMTTRIIDIRSASLLPQRHDELAPFQNIQWMSVLRSLSGYQMYRRHVRLRVSGPLVLRFLLQDEAFPRAVAYCLGRLETGLSRLPRNDAALDHAAQLRRQLREADVQQLAEAGLSSFLDGIQLGLIRLHEVIEQTYFLAGTAGSSEASAPGQ